MMTEPTTQQDVIARVDKATACRAFRISPRTLTAWLKRGAPHVIVDGVIQIDLEQLRQWAVSARCRPNMRGRRFYHLSPVQNLKPILAEGLRSNSEVGAVFVFDDMIVANTIACNQVYTDRYAVFQIDRRGITGAVLADNVGECSAAFQWMVYQDRMKPVHLRHIGTCDAIRDRATEWDYRLHMALHQWNLRQVDAYFECEGWARREINEKKRHPDEVFFEKHQRLQRMLDECADSVTRSSSTMA